MSERQAAEPSAEREASVSELALAFRGILLAAAFFAVAGGVFTVFVWVFA